MTRIAPVNLHFNPRTLWFDAGDLSVDKDDGVVVSTARGTEFGRVADKVFEASVDQLARLKSPLQPVCRKATFEDEQQASAMAQKSAEALPIFKEMAAQINDQMHPVSVEYLFDGDKAVFYFESEERIDFRELVRKLAAYFHVRIDMRQIGVRDEARMVGGLGHCGQELCCKRLGGEFCPVSIRMAKEQDLSLNPQKISGACGRLMCCLRYEFDAYKDFKSRAPKHHSNVNTPLGVAKVIDLDVPRELVMLKCEGEKPLIVPLADFDPPQQGTLRPKIVGQQAWDRALERLEVDSVGDFGTIASSFSKGITQRSCTGRCASCGCDCGRVAPNYPQTTSRDKAANLYREAPRDTGVSKNHSDKHKQINKQKSKKKAAPLSSTSPGKVRRVERTKGSPRDDQKTSSACVRPGQKSSGLRQRSSSEKQSQKNYSAHQDTLPLRTSSDKGVTTSYRRTRKRTHTAGSPQVGGVSSQRDTHKEE